jgi:hypothetical protein
MTFDEFSREFLGLLERREAHLLAWGFYDVSFHPTEIEEILDLLPNQLSRAWRSQERDGWSTLDLLDELERAGLLFRTERDEYRTRFAEGIRLFARLKQMFRSEDWSSGPRLVSDLKFHLVARQYPDRSESADECWADLEPLCWELELQRDVFHALTRQAGKPLQFAGFQRRAFRRILGAYRAKARSGSVVSAGTGSGKTKAFYIPAFLGLVTELGEEHTKIVATYPRNVLLADQLREALSEAKKMDPVLERKGLRSIRFGALLGQTPHEHWLDDPRSRRARMSNWRRVDSGWVVPFLKSLSDTGQELVWRDSDRKVGRTCLYRLNSTADTPEIPDGILALTREQLQARPPDVLFLSLEMLNREMGSPEWARTFGIGTEVTAPRLLLLDEVHAYEGVGGAQVAWVLRRWQHWTQPRGLHIVGLSATLRDAARHLSRVAGLPSDAVAEITPRLEELVSEGMEYNVALKGDPASGAALLSTTIQAGMLLTRLLTPRHLPPIDGHDDRLDPADFYAEKVFGFTDNLDGLNRWYSDFSDAEVRLRLPRLRLHPSQRQPPENVPAPLLRAMHAEGQVWELPRKLGHRLDMPLQISRCSSQDPGANAGSDVIIASASLEVGYDDPAVGAVLHHKRPVSKASFVQRKGRAGRRRGTRPWTVVVLSDYGGDRWTFQNAETLFEPELDRIGLPIRNPHVLRIQATYFLIDWLGHRIGHEQPFRYLSDHRASSTARNAASRLLRDLLSLGVTWHEFRKDFAAVFERPYDDAGTSLSEAELDAILWNAPRPLLRQVIPTLLRKLEADWRYADPNRSKEVEDRGAYRPLPGFLPSATFAELNPTETRLRFEEGDREDVYLGVRRALVELTPGRVSKRYSLRIGEPGYWLRFSDQLMDHDGDSRAAVRQLFADRIFLGQVGSIRVYEPLAADVGHRPRSVSDQSTASWEWQVHLTPIGEGRALPAFYTTSWRDRPLRLNAFLHRDYSGVDVLRYSQACRYEIRTSGEVHRGRLSLEAVADEETSTPEAVGFRLRADGLVLHVDASHVGQTPELDASIQARFRSDYFRDRVHASTGLSDLINRFEADWLWQTSVAMLSETAAANECSLQEAQRLLKGRRADAAKRVLDHIFQVREVSEDGGESRRKREILDLWAAPAVVSEMEQVEAVLWETPGAEFDHWVRQRYVATLAQALRSAAVRNLPDVSEDDLQLDVQWQEDGGVLCILTEESPGGIGQIERIVDSIRTDPAGFDYAIRSVLETCPRDSLAEALFDIARLAARPPRTGDGNAIQKAFRNVRRAEAFTEQEQARDEVRTALESYGLISTRELVVAVAVRLLRAGSSPQTDLWARRLNRSLRRIGRVWGIAVDPRIFAYLCVQHSAVGSSLRDMFRSLSGGQALATSQLYNAVQQFLLPRCKDSCPECLDNPNWMNQFGTPSRDLARCWLGLDVHEVWLESEMADTAYEQIAEALQRMHRVRVVIPPESISPATSLITRILGDVIEVDYLLLPVALRGVERQRRNWVLTLQVGDGSYV